MKSVGGRLMQLFVFVPGAAVSAFTGPSDMPRYATFKAMARKRAPLTFLYSICLYASIAWLALLIRELPVPTPPSVPPTPMAESVAPPDAPVVPPTAPTLPATAALSVHPVPMVQRNEVPRTIDRCAALSGIDQIVCGEPKLAAAEVDVTKRADGILKGLVGTERETLSAQVEKFRNARAYRCGAPLSREIAIPCLTTMYQEELQNLTAIAGALAARTPTTAPRPTSQMPRELQQALGMNLSTAPAGQAIAWGNLATIHGVIVFESIETGSNGAPCRHFSYTLEGMGPGPSTSDVDYACRIPNGTWQKTIPPASSRSHR